MNLGRTGRKQNTINYCSQYTIVKTGIYTEHYHGNCKEEATLINKIKVLIQNKQLICTNLPQIFGKEDFYIDVEL